MKPDRAFSLLGAVFLALGLSFIAIGAGVGGSALFHGEVEARIFLGVFCGIGGLFAVLGSIFLAIPRRRARRNLDLREHGEALPAIITGVERNGAVQVNGRFPYRVVCRYEENGTVYLCRSENLWYDPSQLLTGDGVTVYRDPGNSKRYWVDLSGVLPEVQEL